MEREVATWRFRPEIQGLRALAIGLVVIYHVWIGCVSGGVDTFLFISMFLMTLSLARLVDRGERFSLLGRWLRTFRRLVPLAALSIGLILVAGWLILPSVEWPHL